jgi:hypothetical protein
MDSEVAPTVGKRSSPKPSPVFDTYWRFAAERQRVFFLRMERALPPWSPDPVLRKFKFTNAYRASDRVSQFLIREVIYEGEQTPEEVFFRTILFKLFNKIDTWKLLARELGTISYRDYSFDRFDAVLSAAINRGERIYSGAYIMPSGRNSFAAVRKHQSHLKLLERMMSDRVPQRVGSARSMSEAFGILHAYPMIGDFLAYQFVIDLNYSSLTDFSEMEFVVPGPGARDGIRKCFVDLGGLSESDIVRFVMERQESGFERLGLQFDSLWGRPLQLIDCQNLFCEVDKYARAAHPDAMGISGRTRLKQRFRPSAEALAYWYPPKWGLNEKITIHSRRVGVAR